MIKYCYRLILLFLIPAYALSQDYIYGAEGVLSYNSAGPELGLNELYSFDLLNSDSIRNTSVTGNITSIFHEPIDSAWIIYKIEKLTPDSIFSADGNFYLPLTDINKSKLIELNIKQPEYHFFDTSFVIEPAKTIKLALKLTPRYKISLRGRVFAGNLPVQGVDVQIKVKEKLYNLETKGCYYDSENYWNCLYDGMFKQDLILDKSTDSINLYLEKEGMKPLSLGMVLADYSGDIIDIKMKYASKLSVLPNNCVSLKLSFPFMTLENNWFVDLSYYRLLKGKFFNRFSIGLDANLLLTPVSVTHSTFQENTATFDTSYFSGFIGPSILFWLVKPENRYFSTYLGVTSGLNITSGDLFVQPFIGSRIFVDFNKALSIEVRNASYNLDIVHYTFNSYGNAYRFIESKKFNDFILNVGIQIVF